MTLKAARMNHSVTPVANVTPNTVGFWAGIRAAFKWPTREERRETRLANGRVVPPAAVAKARQATNWPSRTASHQEPTQPMSWAQEECIDKEFYKQLDQIEAMKKNQTQVQSS
eukprot:CAMPEP_0114231738 /NCGR_PEP_ID=MMETSP0058-20121206/4217_1 /TAXON_ID=36894 /ORGANISM="Pyramimonas parkeae, CCMP726" /LENGTH=112 /DNA_ID=CAMNT_0001343133 /DNA_START=147 /DNA_END=485 /DNA_ORIENTATION=-